MNTSTTEYRETVRLVLFSELRSQTRLARYFDTGIGIHILTSVSPLAQQTIGICNNYLIDEAFYKLDELFNGNRMY